MQECEKQFVGVMMTLLDERQRRIFLGSYSQCLGFGSVKELHELTGVSAPTIIAGKRDADEIIPDPKARPSKEECLCTRRPGGGRQSLTEKYPDLEYALLQLLDGNVIGNPENPLCWTTKSERNLEAELRKQGFKIGRETIAQLLRKMNFSLQQNKKYVEGGDHPDRDEQFRHINEKTMEFQSLGQPVVSVDAKKKELIGNYKNNGAEWTPSGQPLLVNVYDFPEEGRKITPYGIYDISRNEGFVNVGISSDTAEFAVNSLRTWWNEMGQSAYPNARSLMITADGGGSNGSRNRLWKKSLQDFANETGLEIHVSHFPPGTSKWNKIEHRLFAYISKNWRGRPLTTLAIVVSLIASTTTREGLVVQSGIDTNEYAKGIKVTDEEIRGFSLSRDEWHGDWNYVISPQN
jgi:hypothetical protein